MDMCTSVIIKTKAYRFFDFLNNSYYRLLKVSLLFEHARICGLAKLNLRMEDMYFTDNREVVLSLEYYNLGSRIVSYIIEISFIGGSTVISSGLRSLELYASIIIGSSILPAS